MPPLGAAALPRWALLAPPLAIGVLAASFGRDPGALVPVVAAVLVAAVLAAVHHAEVVAHRVGEPYGSLILAVAVTVIEVALIVTLMLAGGEGAETLARDTVFAAVMIVTNGVVGICVIVGALRHGVVEFRVRGTSGALATLAALATLSLVLPTFTTGTPGPTFTGAQLAFAGTASLVLYGVFVFVQAVRHRDYFLPVPQEGGRDGRVHLEDAEPDDHAEPPAASTAWTAFALLVVCLVAVVGLAKVVSPTIESAVSDAGLPRAVVGVVIALLVLLPETLAAVRAAARNRMQSSFNLALGSALASIGLTIPTIAVASLWLDGPLVLGLGDTGLVLLVLTVAISTLTIGVGRATVLQGAVHLTVFAAFLVLAVSP